MLTLKTDNERSRERVDFLGRYQILGKVGAGGMAMVHRARCVDSGSRVRPVALKRLLPEFAKHQDCLEMFAKEANVARQLHHPNIVEVFESGSIGEEHFIAMEYVDGWSLAQVIDQAHKTKEGRLPINVTLSLLAELCDALAYAHAATDLTGTAMGIVHRDVSPANILVDRSGHLKLIDFGVCRSRFDGAEVDQTFIKGKLGYVAPEVLHGADARPSTDIFSIGVVAHEMIAGSRLFCSDSDIETLEKILYGRPQSPRLKNPSCTLELAATVMRALAREPAERIASCADLRDELELLYGRNGVRDGKLVANWLRSAFSTATVQRYAKGTGEFPDARQRFGRGSDAKFDDGETPVEHPVVGHYGEETEPISAKRANATKDLRAARKRTASEYIRAIPAPNLVAPKRRAKSAPILQSLPRMEFAVFAISIAVAALLLGYLLG